MDARFAEHAAAAGSVVAAYDRMIASGEITGDPAQEAIAHRLDDLAEALVESGQRTGLLRRLVGGRGARPPAGLYIWGDVGRGKTMLMDMFYGSVAARRKRRAHFNDFMADVHARIRKTRDRNGGNGGTGGDPIPVVAAAIAEETRLICFDEFAVSDIADAMILARLFTALFEAGVTLVATSNVAPDDLYAGGLNRQHIVPFIRLLKSKVEIARLDAAADYRLEKLEGRKVYFRIDAPGAADELGRLWRRLLGGRACAPGTLAIGSRKIPVPMTCQSIARFSFADLCTKPLGASDYLAIARRFHTVVVENVPVIRPEQRNEAKRFINLIDVFYDSRVRLIVSAAAEPDDLFLGEEGTEAFEFRRTASRLHEMRSASYLHDVEDTPMT